MMTWRTISDSRRLRSLRSIHITKLKVRWWPPDLAIAILMHSEETIIFPQWSKASGLVSPIYIDGSGGSLIWCAVGCLDDECRATP